MIVSDWAGSRGDKWQATLEPMEVMLQPVNEPLIRSLAFDKPARIADIGCGGGGSAIEVLLRAPEGSVVHGFDVSPTLIEAARARSVAASDALHFAVADMETSSPPNGLYDRLLSRFGVMFFHDPLAAFANMRSWLTPGGRFAFAVWDSAAANPWLARVREVVAEVVEIPGSRVDEPGPFRYADASVLLDTLNRSGYADLELRTWRGSLTIGTDPLEAASFALASFSSFAELLAKAEPDAASNARTALTTRFAELSSGGVVSLGCSVHIATGTRPAI